MSRDDILLEAEMSMEKSVDYMVHEFAAVRTGKASPGLVENVDVHAYGSAMKLKQLALITTPEPRLLVVQPFDAGTVQDIERALKESKIGITPAVDGKIIRLPIPELSEERRKNWCVPWAKWPRKPVCVARRIGTWRSTKQRS
jgi:ribosome recycling factor